MIDRLPEDSKARGWLWIIGPPRSGTTAMVWALNRHPEVLVTHETLWFRCLSEAFAPPVPLHPVSGVAETTWAQREGEAVHRTPWPLPRLTQTWPRMDWNFAPRAEECVRACAVALRGLYPPVQWFGDKAPALTPHWRSIIRVLPQSRFVVMERPAEECVASLLRQPWGRGISEAEHRSNVDKWIAEGRAAEPAIRVALGDLKASPQFVLEEVLRYFDLDLRTYPMERVLERLAEGPIN